jgi:hypothetical protein
MFHQVSMALAIVALMFSPALGDLKKIKGNWTVKNESGSDATDFHISARIKGPASYVTGQFYNDGTFVAPGEKTATFTPEGNDQLLKLDWKTNDNHVAVGNNASIHLGYDFQSSSTDISIYASYWTASGDPIPSDTRSKDPKLPGFKTGSFHLTNDTGSEMIVQDLQFLISSSEVPLPALMPYTFGGWGTSAGPGTFVPTFSIPDSGVSDLTSYLPAAVGASEFLLYQFRSYGTAGPGPITAGMLEIQGPISNVVPEPSALPLIVAAVVACNSRRVASRRARAA